MRCFCVVLLLAGTVGSVAVLVAGQQQSAGGLKGTKPREQPRADIPQGFEFLFQSPEQRIREEAKRPTYWEDLWKGLPYDSISLERGPSGGCLGGCAYSIVTLYRATVSGVRMPALCRTTPCPPGELRGRAALATVAAVSASDVLASLPGAALQPPQPPQPLQPPAPRISEGSVRVYEFANLSYLLHKLRFMELPYEYKQDGFDRPFVTVIVAAGGKAKAVTDYGDERPVELWAFQQAFDAVSKSIQWTQK